MREGDVLERRVAHDVGALLLRHDERDLAVRRIPDFGADLGDRRAGRELPVSDGTLDRGHLRQRDSRRRGRPERRAR